MAVLNAEAPEYIYSGSQQPTPFATYQTQPFLENPVYYNPYQFLYFCPYAPPIETLPSICATLIHSSLPCPFAFQHCQTLPDQKYPSPLQITDPEDLVVEKEVVCEEILSSVPAEGSNNKGGDSVGRRGRNQMVYTKRKLLVWKPKVVSPQQQRPYQKIEHKEQFESDSIQPDGDKTTVMIRNIPNKISGAELLTILDERCHKMNKERSESTNGEESFSSAFDFLYLPIDFDSKCNKGYAFVNFTDARAAWGLHAELHHWKWNILNSKKVCEITYARIQGKEDLINHFEGSSFTCERDDYLPMHFKPARDGSGAPVQQCTVGKRMTPIRARRGYRRG